MLRWRRGLVLALAGAAVVALVVVLALDTVPGTAHRPDEAERAASARSADREAASPLAERTTRSSGWTPEAQLASPARGGASEGARDPVGASRGQGAPPLPGAERASAATTAAPPVVAPPPAGEAPLTRSPRTNERSSLLVLNTCSFDVDLVWLDFEGDGRSYRTIPSGGQTGQLTYVGHVWALRESGPAGREVRRFASTASDFVEACDESDPAFVEAGTPAHALCSTPSYEELDMELVNGCAEPVEMVWVAFDCSSSTRGRVEPGATFLQHTFAGHVWKAIGEDGDVISHFVASPARPQMRLCGDT